MKRNTSLADGNGNYYKLFPNDKCSLGHIWWGRAELTSQIAGLRFPIVTFNHSMQTNIKNTLKIHNHLLGMTRFLYVRRSWGNVFICIIFIFFFSCCWTPLLKMGYMEGPRGTCPRAHTTLGA